MKRSLAPSALGFKRPRKLTGTIVPLRVSVDTISTIGSFVGEKAVSERSDDSPAESYAVGQQTPSTSMVLENAKTFRPPGLLIKDVSRIALQPLHSNTILKAGTSGANSAYDLGSESIEYSIISM